MLSSSSSRLFVLAFAPTLAACAASTPPPSAPPPSTGPVASSDTPSTAAPPTGPCASKDACEGAGDDANKAGDKDRAKQLYEAGCGLGSGHSCMELGLIVRDDRSKAIDLELKGCELGSVPGCFNAAEWLRQGPRAQEAIALYATVCKKGEGTRGLACERGARTAYLAQDFEHAAQIGSLGCTDSISSACDTLGVLYANGEGVAKDLGG